MILVPELSTGLVIAGAYADKLRRTLFAQLRDQMKQGLISGQEIARAAAEINRMLYEIIVNDLKVDKGDVVRIRISYDISGGSIKWITDTLRIEVFRRVPDEEVMEAVRKRISGMKTSIEMEAPRIKGVRSAAFLGSTIDDAYLFLLKDQRDENIGLALVREVDGASDVDAIIIPGGGEKPVRINVKISKPRGELKEEPERLIEALGAGEATPISEDDARRLIQENMKKLI